MGVALLLKSSADKKLRDAAGRTALMLARERNHYGSHLAVLKAFGRRKGRKLASPVRGGVRSSTDGLVLDTAAMPAHETREVSIQCDLESCEESSVVNQADA